MRHKNGIYGDHYSPMKALSYKRNFIVSMGTRSIGKSTGWTIWALLEFINKGKQFIYVRRTKDELDATAPSAMDNAVDIVNQYYNMHIEMFYKGGKYFIKKGKRAIQCGWAIALSMEYKYKSVNLSSVEAIIYDEFIPRNGRYLGGKGNPYFEKQCLDSLMQTADRGIGKAFRNEVIVICIGNNMTFYNPIILDLGADKYLGFEVKYLHPKNAYWLVEQTLDVEATKNKSDSNVFKMADERTRQYAFYGGVDDNKFIGKPKGRLQPLINFKYKNAFYAIYLSNETYQIYVENKENKTVKTLALTMDDHSVNYLLVDTWRDNPVLKMIKDRYNRGEVLFANGKCKYMMNTIYSYDIML